MYKTLLFLMLSVAPCSAVAVKVEQQPLVVYAVTSTFANHSAQAFTAKYGIAVRVIPMRSNGTTLSRIQSEQAAPKADIWFGGSLGAHAQAATEGLLSPYKSRHYEVLQPQLRNPMGNDMVQSLYAGILVFAVNKDLLADKQVPIPMSWQELNKPVYHGLIGLRNPTLSGTGFTMVLSLVALMGEDRAFEYIKALYRDAGSVGGRQISSLVNQKTAITVMFLHDFLSVKKVDDSLDFVMPAEGTGYEIGGLSLIKNRPNTAIAKQFTDFVLDQAQQKHHLQSSARLPINSRVNLNDEALDLDNTKLVKMDFAWAGVHRQRLLNRWMQVNEQIRFENRATQ